MCRLDPAALGELAIAGWHGDRLSADTLDPDT
jgi:hypothetical protein